LATDRYTAWGHSDGVGTLGTGVSGQADQLGIPTDSPELNWGIVGNSFSGILPADNQIVCSIVVFDEVLSPARIQAIEDYWEQKYYTSPPAVFDNFETFYDWRERSGSGATAEWNNQTEAGDSYDFFASTGTAVTETVVNNRRAWNFNGTVSNLRTLSAIPITGPVTFFFVVDLQGSLDTNWLIADHVSKGSESFYIFSTNSATDGKYRMRRGASATGDFNIRNRPDVGLVTMIAKIDENGNFRISQAKNGSNNVAGSELKQVAADATPIEYLTLGSSWNDVFFSNMNLCAFGMKKGLTNHQEDLDIIKYGVDEWGAQDFFKPATDKAAWASYNHDDIDNESVPGEIRWASQGNQGTSYDLNTLLGGQWSDMTKSEDPMRSPGLKFSAVNDTILATAATIAGVAANYSWLIAIDSGILVNVGGPSNVIVGGRNDANNISANENGSYQNYAGAIGCVTGNVGGDNYKTPIMARIRTTTSDTINVITGNAFGDAGNGAPAGIRMGGNPAGDQRFGGTVFSCHLYNFDLSDTDWGVWIAYCQFYYFQTVI
jgi:hypothetical protein